MSHSLPEIEVTTEVIEDITEDTIWFLGGFLTGLLHLQKNLQKNHQLKIGIVEDDLDPDQDLVQDRQIGDLKEVTKNNEIDHFAINS